MPRGRKHRKLTRQIAEKIIPVNSSEQGYAEHRFILWVGQGAPTYLMVWADHLEDAMEVMCDWVVDNAPGLLADDEVNEEYKRVLAEKLEEGMDEEKAEEEAQEEAEVGTTVFGHSGIHYIRSDDWGIVSEDPTRADILGIQDRPAERRARGVDRLAKKRAKSTPRRDAARYRADYGSSHPKARW